MESIRIGIRENADLVISQPGQVIAAGINTESHRDIMHFGRAKNFLRIHLPSVQNFAPQRQNGLELAGTCLFSGTPSGVPLYQKQLAIHRIFCGAVSKLARQGRARRNLFTHHLFRRTQSRLSSIDAELSEQFCVRGMLIQPKAECVFGDTGNKPRRFS